MEHLNRGTLSQSCSLRTGSTISQELLATLAQAMAAAVDPVLLRIHWDPVRFPIRFCLWLGKVSSLDLG